MLLCTMGPATCRSHVFSAVGTYPNGVFLYGFLVQQILIQFFGGCLTPWRLFAATALVAGAFARASWHFIEVRALAYKPKPARAKVHSGVLQGAQSCAEYSSQL